MGPLLRSPDAAAKVKRHKLPTGKKLPSVHGAGAALIEYRPRAEKLDDGALPLHENALRDHDVNSDRPVNELGDVDVR
jgi:hypothetical protein